MMDLGRWTIRVALAVLVLSASTPFAQEDGRRSSDTTSEPGRRNDTVYALYELMAGLWNAPAGGSRVTEACDMTGEILERVRKLATRPIPEYAAMIRSSIALKEACEDNQDAAVDREIDRIGFLFYRARIARMIYK